MSSWRGAVRPNTHTKSWLYKEVDKCRQNLIRNGITEITIQNICDEFPHIKVEYMHLESSGLRGLVFLADKISPINAIIINSNLSENEQHFHSIHEYMHICLHSDRKAKSIACFELSTKKNQDSMIEWEANEGSAELLIPYREFIPQFVARLSELEGNTDFWELMYGANDIFDVFAKQYKVSRNVIKNRISSLSYEIDQYRNGTSVDQINVLSYNQLKNKGTSVTDYIKLINQIQCKYYFKPLDWNDTITAIPL